MKIGPIIPELRVREHFVEVLQFNLWYRKRSANEHAFHPHHAGENFIYNRSFDL